MKTKAGRRGRAAGARHRHRRDAPARELTAASSPTETAKTALRREETPRPRHSLSKLRVRTSDIYVGRLFLEGYLVCAFSFLGLFIAIETFSKLDRFLRQDGSFFLAVLRYNAAMVPMVYAKFLGPIITLGAAMFALTTLNRNNELTPLKASGVSVYRICAPIFLLATAFMGFTFYLQERVVPEHKHAIREALQIVRGKPIRNVSCHDAKNDLHIMVDEYSPTQRIARGVHVERGASERIKAYQMEWRALAGDPGGAGRWILHDASIQRWDEDGLVLINTSAKPGQKGIDRLKERHRLLPLETRIRPVDLETGDLDISYLSWNSYLSWRELQQQYRRQPQHLHLAVKLHHHFAFPLSHIILLLLGIPFILNTHNRSVFLGLVGCFLICGLFHLVSSISLSVAMDREFFGPLLAAWLPVLLFGSLGITLFDHLPT